MTYTKLRALQLNDLDNILGWINDSDVTGVFANVKTPVSREEEQTYLERILASETDYMYAIEDEAGRYLGNIGLHQINRQNNSSRFALIIGRKDCWGMGYGQSAVKELLKKAFEEHQLHKVWGVVLEENTRNQHIYLDKCGFTVEGLLRDEYFHEGQYHNMLRIAMTKDEYQKKYGKLQKIHEVEAVA